MIRACVAISSRLFTAQVFAHNVPLRTHYRNSYLAWDDSRMREQNLGQGVAGSLTMILLTVACVILFRSFYKRYKRMEERRIQDEQK